MTETEQLQKQVQRLEDVLDRWHKVIVRFVQGEPLEDESWLVERLEKYRKDEAEKRAFVFATSDKKMPPLTVAYGSSGLEVRALLDESYDCVEYRTVERTAQQIMVAPWIQFQPSALADEKLRITMEVVRRAMLHDALVAQMKREEVVLKSWQDGNDMLRAEMDRVIEKWREERVAAGKPADFSDVRL